MKPLNSCLWQSSLHSAIGILFSNDEHWLDFFYFHKGGGLRLEPQELIAESRCFSRGEQLMIRVALDLWTDGSYVSLAEILNTLDFENLNRVLLAIMTVRDVSIEDIVDVDCHYES